MNSIRFASVCSAPLLRTSASTSRHTTPRRILPAAQSAARLTTMAAADQKLDKSTPDSTWKQLLSAEEFNILRQKGTEPAGSGLYNKHKEAGEFACAGCGTVLYKSTQKFDSGCGWPAFYDNVEGAVERHEDSAFGMKRVEITCSNCGGHLGHIFEGEGFPTPTDQRHCVNSKSIKFKQ